jgi:hypothetical protein
VTESKVIQTRDYAAEYAERQSDFFTRNPFVRESLTVQQLHQGRGWLAKLWEDTQLQTKGGMNFVGVGTLISVFDMAISDAERSNHNM